MLIDKLDFILGHLNTLDHIDPTVVQDLDNAINPQLDRLGTKYPELSSQAIKLAFGIVLLSEIGVLTLNMG